jgi:hypothetical protein
MWWRSGAVVALRELHGTFLCILGFGELAEQPQRLPEPDKSRQA